MDTYFTSDLHFGHENIIKYCERPFNSVEHMNEVLIANWNAIVNPTDEVWVLGDLAMGRIDETLPLVARLNGHLILLTGNHDRCWPYAKKMNPTKLADWRLKYLAAGFSEIYDGVVERPTLIDARLCHFPYIGDSQGYDRFPDQRPADTGGWLVHGHVHDEWKIKDRMINVGTDVWDYTPVNVEVLKEIIQGG